MTKHVKTNYIGIHEPKIIFDSREAKRIYKEYNYYRSASFIVPPGYVAVVELTADEFYLQTMTFTAIREVADSSIVSQCYPKACLGKRYKRWRCYQGLGEDIPNTKFDEFNASTVRWGDDYIRQEIVEFEYVVRPGRYYLIADKCHNEVLEDCTKPTIIEVTLIPVDHIPDLDLPGCKTTCLPICDSSEEGPIV